LEKAASYYKLSADQNHAMGAFNYAFCLHYGIGVEIDLEEAAKYYELSARHRESNASPHNFRCLRSQNRAQFTATQFPEIFQFRLQVLEESKAARPFTSPSLIADYLVEPFSSGPGPLIGTGGAARVTLEKDRFGGRKFAVKHISTPTFDKVPFFREIESMVKLKHPCILSILGYVLPSSPALGEIHTEYAENGSRAEVLKRRGFRTIPNAWNPTAKAIIITGIVLGMKWVHSHGIIHRDLKPGNIMINALGRVLIGDFGASCLENEDRTMTSETGTVHYAAPEMFQDVQYTNKVDIFSFALIVYEILVGAPVFSHDESPFQVMRRLRSGDMAQIPDSCGWFMQELIPRCWSKDPESRPSFQTILDEFRSNNFAIFPGADATVICEYVCGIFAWEDQQRLFEDDVSAE
jgi:serine/threonine protein kinase